MRETITDILNIDPEFTDPTTDMLTEMEGNTPIVNSCISVMGPNVIVNGVEIPHYTDADDRG